MTKRHLTLAVRLGAAVTALALAASGCGSSDDSGDGGGDDKTISIGIIQGWTDTVSTAYLYKNLLENNGYTVEIKELADVAPIYAGLARGDMDVMSSSWYERTQAVYWEQYSDDLEDVGTYYDDATNFLAVPTYSDVESIADLPSHADEFGGVVTGIEPGAGLTKLTKDNVFPAYGLDDSFKLVLSSTPAMLTELKKATDAKEPIVVTLWKPFWANQSFPVRPLEDPEKAYGDPEGCHTIARKGFSEDYPEVAEMMSHLKMTDEQYGTLEDTIVNKYDQGQEEEAVQDWLDKNPDFAPPLEKYLKN